MLRSPSTIGGHKKRHLAPEKPLELLLYIHASSQSGGRRWELRLRVHRQHIAFVLSLVSFWRCRERSFISSLRFHRLPPTRSLLFLLLEGTKMCSSVTPPTQPKHRLCAYLKSSFVVAGGFSLPHQYIHNHTPENAVQFSRIS